MEVPLALLADYANISREGKLNVMGVFNRISARQFPTVHPEMQLVFRLEAGPAERGQEKVIEIKLLDEDARLLQHLTGHLTVPTESPTLVVQMDQVIKFSGTTFEKPGSYRFDILVGGETKRTVEFSVEQIPGSDEG